MVLLICGCLMLWSWFTLYFVSMGYDGLWCMQGYWFAGIYVDSVTLCGVLNVVVLVLLWACVAGGGDD